MYVLVMTFSFTDMWTASLVGSFVIPLNNIVRHFLGEKFEVQRLISTTLL